MTRHKDIENWRFKWIFSRFHVRLLTSSEQIYIQYFKTVRFSTPKFYAKLTWYFQFFQLPSLLIYFKLDDSLRTLVSHVQAFEFHSIQHTCFSLNETKFEQTERIYCMVWEQLHEAKKAPSKQKFPLRAGKINKTALWTKSNKKFKAALQQRRAQN